MEQPIRRRRRPALSCLECRRRKIKCDRNEPCAHCVATRNRCTYRLFEGTLAPRNRESPGSRSPRRDRASESLSTQPTSTSPSITGRVRSNDPQALERVSFHGLEVAPDLQDLVQRVQRLERTIESNTASGLSPSTGSNLPRASACGDRESQVVLKKARMWRWSDWMSEAREFQTVFDCYTAYTSTVSDENDDSRFQDPETRALAVRIGELVRSCKSLARSLKMGRPSRNLSAPLLVDFVPPSRELADAMVVLYLESFESTHRILHKPTFRAEYERFWDEPHTVANDLRLKILLVIGLGSSLYVEGEPGAANFHSTVRMWVYAAQAWLSGPLEKDRLRVTGIQVHCLTIIARQVFSVGGDLVWMSTGSLIHRAMQIGLHRDPRHLSAMSILQAELRRRLWATVLELVVQASLDSAMPPRISFDEFDTEAPSNINDDEVDESTAAIEPHPSRVHTETSLQLLLLECLPIRLRVLRLLNGLRSELSYPDVLELSSGITDAYRRNMAFMTNPTAETTAFQRNLVDYLVKRFLIPLHCPFASRARTSPLFQYSIKASLDASMDILYPEPDAAFARLMAVGGGMFKEGFRYASAAISLEYIAMAEAQSLDGTLRRGGSHCREILRKAMEDMVELSAERARQGETNIKGHMFLTMILAQVRAMEDGVPGEFRIAKGAKSSLEFCHSLLQARAAVVPSSSWSGDSVADTEGLDGAPGGLGMDWNFDFFLPDGDFS
ncbi:hypothetical protein CPLU01_10167 [Colletotrichum plurivorum]|uniref:Zn(2)-C6 fungal-type domain-containing protein n=1 Tax=Colletotrichum plurivorum TaxID=2175906 RepID=A0A8H6N9W5_9PEZI|nr:hypothetical protein CPLU01_10167 [Colletotrichum plurivorum]